MMIRHSIPVTNEIPASGGPASAVSGVTSRPLLANLNEPGSHVAEPPIAGAELTSVVLTGLMQ